MKSRVRVLERISRKWNGNFLSSPKNWDGDEDLHLHLEIVVPSTSLIFFFSFSSFPSPFFLCLVHPCSSLKREMQSGEWMSGSELVLLRYASTLSWPGAKRRGRRIAHQEWLYCIIDLADGPSDHRIVREIIEFWEKWFGEKGLMLGFLLLIKGLIYTLRELGMVPWQLSWRIFSKSTKCWLGLIPVGLLD